VSSIEVNGIRIYYEKRGRGPAVLFVSGASGDAGHWTTVADILADTYTVITYDRRGNSRSPRPPGWTSTTIGEQADDAAALLRGLDLVPAIVVGTSAAAGAVTTVGQGLGATRVRVEFAEGFAPTSPRRAQKDISPTVTSLQPPMSV